MLWLCGLTAGLLLAVHSTPCLAGGTIQFRLANFSVEPLPERRRSVGGASFVADDVIVRTCLRRPTGPSDVHNCSERVAGLESRTLALSTLIETRLHRLKFDGNTERLKLKIELLFPNGGLPMEHHVLLSRSNGHWSSWSTLQGSGMALMVNVNIRLRWKVKCNQDTFCPAGLCAYDCGHEPSDHSRPGLTNERPAPVKVTEPPSRNQKLNFPYLPLGVEYGNHIPCNASSRGLLWYSPIDGALRVCDGEKWRCAEPGSCQAVSLSEGQDLPPYHIRKPELHPVEPFSFSDFQTFEDNTSVYLVACHGTAPGQNTTAESYVFKRQPGGRFRKLQVLRNLGNVRGCRIFNHDGKRYLAAVRQRLRTSNNVENAEVVTLLWSSRKEKFKRRFEWVSTLSHHDVRGCDVFSADGLVHMIAVGQSNTRGTWITILHWSGETHGFQTMYNVDHSRQHRKIVRIQQSPSSVKHFKMSGVHFLALSLNFDHRRQTTVVESPIFIVQVSHTKRGSKMRRTAHLQLFQRLKTTGASHFEHFQIGADLFLAVANSLRFIQEDQNSGDQMQVLNTIPSTIYRFAYKAQVFVPFQNITLTEANHWHHFSICSDHYLAVSSRNKRIEQGDRIPPSIFKWRGIEGFVEWHKAGPEDSKTWRWQYVKFGRSHYLAQLMSTKTFAKSHLFRINVDHCGCQPRF